jgi:hypothetical protein
MQAAAQFLPRVRKNKVLVMGLYFRGNVDFRGLCVSKNDQPFVCD